MAHHPDSTIARRDFARLLAGTIGAAALGGRRTQAAQPRVAPGIKLCVQSPAAPSDEQLLFLKQLGAEYISVGAPPDLRTAEGFAQIKKRYADAGITVWNIGNVSVHNMQEVTLNLPGRDPKIEEYKPFLRNLGKAGSATPRTHTWETASGPRPASARGIRAGVRSKQPHARELGRQGVQRSVVARPRVHAAGNLGELRVFH